MAGLKIFRRLAEMLDLDETNKTAGYSVVVNATEDGYELADVSGGGGGSDDQTAAEVPFTPAGNLASTDVQAALEELDSEKVGQAELDALEAQAVILEPAASSRNVVVPSAGDVIALVVRGFTGQTADLMQWQADDDTVMVAVSSSGQLLVGATPAASPLALGMDMLVGGQPVAGFADMFGSTFLKQAIALLVQHHAPNLAATDTAAVYNGMAGSVRGPAGTARYFGQLGLDYTSIFRGTAADSSSVQASLVYGARASALDYSFDTGGDAATGRIQSLVGVEGYASHAGQSRVNSLTGVHAYAQANKLLTSNPGPIGTKIAALIAETNVDANVSGTVPAIYGVDVLATLGATATVVAGVKVRNHGASGVATSYGILIDAQSGATNVYGLYVAGGRSVMVDGLLVGKTSAYADADIANSQGGWWWDAANSVPKWKGKQSDGTVVNFTPQKQDADLDTWATLTPSAFFQTLVDDADAATARATLGVIASLFQSGGAQAIKLDDLAAPDDNTDLNVSTTKHGLAPKLPNDATKYLDGTGAYSVPAGGGGGTDLGYARSFLMGGM